MLAGEYASDFVVIGEVDAWVDDITPTSSSSADGSWPTSKPHQDATLAQLRKRVHELIASHAQAAAAAYLDEQDAAAAAANAAARARARSSGGSDDGSGDGEEQDGDIFHDYTETPGHPGRRLARAISEGSSDGRSLFGAGSVDASAGGLATARGRLRSTRDRSLSPSGSPAKLQRAGSNSRLTVGDGSPTRSAAASALSPSGGRTRLLARSPSKSSVISGVTGVTGVSGRSGPTGAAAATLAASTLAAQQVAQNAVQPPRKLPDIEPKDDLGDAYTLLQRLTRVVPPSASPGLAVPSTSAVGAASSTSTAAAPELLLSSPLSSPRTARVTQASPRRRTVSVRGVHWDYLSLYRGGRVVMRDSEAANGPMDVGPIILVRPHLVEVEVTHA